MQTLLGETAELCRAVVCRDHLVRQVQRVTLGYEQYSFMHLKCREIIGRAKTIHASCGEIVTWTKLGKSQSNLIATNLMKCPLSRQSWTMPHRNREKMTTYKLALIGFGGVNRALAGLIDAEPKRFARLGLDLRVVAITDLSLGSLVQPDGIDLGSVLGLQSGDSFSRYPGGSLVADNETVIRDAPADIVIEATFTNAVDGEPAVSHVTWALNAGKHVATTNKGPIAFQGTALTALARARGLQFEYEGSVLSGTPLLGLVQRQLAGLELRGFEGILNGTSNYVLGRMEVGLSLAEAIAEAQAAGYAEADPAADIGGSDVRLKVAILANELLGADISPAQVSTIGIEGLSAEDVLSASVEGKRWKLLGSAYRLEDGSVKAEVRPFALEDNHPLANIQGATNAVSIDTDLIGTVTISGPGAGRVETAYAIIADIISIDAKSRDLAHV